MTANENELEAWNDINFDDPDFLRLLDNGTVAPLAQESRSNISTDLNCSGFDIDAGQSWIYPSNLQCRTYQYSISQAALYRNTLVVLPTGLGKTFIAAVVMYNFYRWYPQGKIIFMAPTRPLVAQQIEACQKVMPFAKNETVELTGKLQRPRRLEFWRTKRVFFATPQVVQSDIMSAIDLERQTDFPFKEIKLLVIDEAHRARGRYAYKEVVDAIWQRNRNFRILALSATPGRTVDDVIEVVRNLFISHVEVRWDNSIDVMPFIHKRTMKTIVVPLSDEIKSLREQMVEIIDPYLRQLIDAGVLSGSLRNISRNFLLFEQKNFRNQSITQRHPQQAAVNSNFSICISLYHALELLERHGMRAFLNLFDEDDEGRVKYILAMDGRLRGLVSRLRSQLGPNPFDVSTHVMTNGQIPQVPKDLDFGHPKFDHARNCLMAHFEVNKESRAIVFCEYRESVMLIYRLLLQQVPLLRPRCFVGQGGTNGSIRALTQKQQIQIMSDFRSGKSNILIATSIGEEGIDVGEVDLIVCFDISTSNPQRFVQRIGRTGRQRQGNVIMLVTEGREQSMLKDVLANKDATNKKLVNSSVLKSALYMHAPRMVPANLTPQCVKTYVPPPVERDREPEIETAARKKTKRKATVNEKPKAIELSQDLRRFFKPSQQVAENQDSPFKKAPVVSKSRIIPSKPAEVAVDDSGQSSGAQRDTKSLRKINKILKSATPLVPQSKRGLNLMEQLQSDLLSKEVKLFLLRQSPDFVRDAMEKMSILLALDVEMDLMSNDERKIRDTYELVESLFGSRMEVEIFLEEAECQHFKTLCVTMNEDEEEIDSGEFDECLERIFTGLDRQGHCWDNFDYIQQELKKTKRYQRFLGRFNDSSFNESMAIVSAAYQTVVPDYDDKDEAFQSSANESTIDIITDSKYCSQWKTQVESTVETPGGCASMVGNENSDRDLKNFEDGNDDIIFMADIPELTSSKIDAKTPKMKQKPPIPMVKVSTPVVCPPVMGNSSTPQADASSKLANFSHFLHPTTPSLGRESTPKTKMNGLLPIQSDAPSATATADHMDMLDELDMDMDAFLEPFPEEELYTSERPAPSSSGDLATRSKENIDCNNVSSPLTQRQSPDLFELDESKTPKELAKVEFPKRTLAAKLAAKSSPRDAANAAGSPVKRLSTAPKVGTSPSIFDIFMKSMANKSPQLASPLVPQSTRGSSPVSSREPLPEDESIIVPRRQPRASKRKIFESDSEQEDVDMDSTVVEIYDSKSDSDEIPMSQKLSTRRKNPAKKRLRRCAFLDEEAAVEDDTHVSDDEIEATNDQYFLDSVVVSSEDEPDDGPSATQMKAVYLKSLKSPQQRAGGFKIPAPRVYNDHMEIYSQTQIIENSQYEDDSFVVQGTEHVSVNESLCPLERAELILKERRRAKRQMAKTKSVANKEPAGKKRIYCIADSSDDDEEGKVS